MLNITGRRPDLEEVGGVGGSDGMMRRRGGERGAIHGRSGTMYRESMDDGLVPLGGHELMSISARISERR